MTAGQNGRRVKIGLIVDSTTVSQYVADLIEWSADCDEPPITHLIIQNVPGERPRSSERIAAMLWRAILGVERRMILKGASAIHFKTCDVSRLVAHHIHVAPITSPSGADYRYSEDDVARLRAQNFDLFIRCGSGILRGEVLGAARDGVISLCHADDTLHRGGPAAFWEVYWREPSSGFMIQQLTDEPDVRNVLLRGRFPTATFYLRNQADLYRRSNYYLIQFLKKYLAVGHLPAPQPNVPYSGRPGGYPGPAVLLHYLVRNVLDFARLAFVRHLLRRQHTWGVSFVRRPWREATLWRGQRIRAPERHFFADPFVVSREGTDYCFVEDYDYDAGRACISALALTNGGAKFLGPVIVEPFHMSFPCIFEAGSKIYMVPETCESNDIRLYEAVEFPTRWRLASIVMAGVSAADSMIFEREGRWWLFTSINPLGEGDHCSELMIYYSDGPLDGTWQAHAENPIYIDPERARNGGLLRDGSDIYRVAQTQGFNQYGLGARIYKIVELTPTAYREELEAQLRPTFYPALRGTHHMHGNEQITVFDHVESVDAPLGLPRAGVRRRFLSLRSGSPAAEPARARGRAKGG